MIPVGTIIGGGMIGAAFMDVISMGIACAIGTKLGHNKSDKTTKPSNPRMFKVVKKRR